MKTMLRPLDSVRRRDPADPLFRIVELAQRGRMIIDVAAADLEAAEERLGSFHEITWHFRNALNEARRSWDRLRAEFGGPALESALAEPPLTILSLGETKAGFPGATLIVIAGMTYCVERVAGTALAPVLWRLTRLPLLEDGPYYLARLQDGSTRCDCAEWTYHLADTDAASSCKHLSAVRALGWL